jgi:uncharacterized protein with PIN domain
MIVVDASALIAILDEEEDGLPLLFKGRDFPGVC